MPTPNGPQNQPRWDLDDEADFPRMATAASDYAAKVGNRRRDTATARNNASGLDVFAGLEWTDTDTGDVWLRNPANTAWVLIFRPMQAYTPTITGVTLGTSPTNTHMYSVDGNWVHVWGTIKLGPGGSFGDVLITAPTTPRSGLPDLFPVGTVMWIDDSAGTTGRYAGVAYMSAAGAIRLVHTEVNDQTVISSPFQNRDPDVVNYSVQYPRA